MAAAIETGVSLGKFNTFGVEARAAYFASVRDLEQLRDALADPRVVDLPRMILGGGSNILFTRDFDGLVVKIDIPGYARIGDDGARWLVRVGAGESWHGTVVRLLDDGLHGLENLALIPGSVGGAPIQNIGAYGLELAERLQDVDVFDPASGALDSLDVADCRFGYRDSIFKREPDRWIVSNVEFRFDRARRPALDYAGVREELATLGGLDPTPTQVASAVRRLRRRKLPDPASIGNAGSFFKNPVLANEHASRLKAANPSLPVYPAAEGSSKLSAAWLIEACGWRGFREGDAGISAQHALVLVNHGHATGVELLMLARRVAESVGERFGVRLEPEPRIVGAEF
jgi:UDP-N-acetylmuramate dehydrogenase